MSKGRVLVVEDEEDILELMRFNLAREGFSVECAASGERGLEVARAAIPDLVLLDLMLPGIDGLDVCREMKRKEATRGIPIIMVTAKGEETDIVTGLELGADDYICKPFSPKVLVSRVKAVLRRPVHGDSAAAVLKIDNLLIDGDRYKVVAEEEELDLTLSEFKILQFLAINRGRVYTRYQIVDAVHGEDYPVTDRSIDVQVVGLRRKLGTHGAMIETVRGVGYRVRE